MVCCDGNGFCNNGFIPIGNVVRHGDIDPATNKKIQTYVRTIVGDTCTITIVYADGTKSTETINKDIQVSPEKIDVNYGE